MLSEDSAFARIYQVLDQVLCGAGVPAGARGIMYDVVDELRADADVRQEARIAEDISVQLHKLECALQRRDGQEEVHARQALKSLATEFLARRICTRH